MDNKRLKLFQSNADSSYDKEIERYKNHKDTYRYPIKILDPLGLHLRIAMNLSRWRDTAWEYKRKDVWLENESGQVATFDSVISIGLLNVLQGETIYMVSVVPISEDRLLHEMK